MPDNIAAVSLKDKLISYRYNYANIARVAFQTLTDAQDGTLLVVDPSNPTVASIEFAAFCAAAAMQRDEVLNRFQYPVMAQTLEQLYRHMSDQDYINRFAIPAQAKIQLLIPYNELMSRMLPDPDTEDMRLVIPANSTFTVANTVFSLQYPIIIRQLQQGGLQVLYDTSVTSPLQTLDSNDLGWEILDSGTQQYLAFTFDTYQFDITSATHPISSSSLFQFQFPYPDQFYFARVYIQNTDRSWSEIYTTHSDLVYDIATMTAQLELLDNNILQVTIPQIYTANNQARSTVRVDIYTTKGALQMSLGDYTLDQWGIAFKSVDSNDPLTYSAPLSTFTSQIYALSRDTVNGGSNGMDYETMRRQVINNSTGPQEYPISRTNLTEELLNLGYSVVTDIDNVTNRLFLATRQLPDPVNSNLITAAGTTNETVTFAFTDIIGRSYVIDHAANNHNAITITPDAVYQDNNGIVSFVTDAQLAALNSLTPDQKALQITNGNYRYTPFHYVLDLSENDLSVNAYYLDSPIALSKVFVSKNPKVQLQVTTAAYELTRTKTGYQLTITTQSDSNFQALDDNEIYVQLAVFPEGEVNRAYINGTQVSKSSTGERTYQFDLSSTMYLDRQDSLGLSKMFMFTMDPRETFVSLTSTFDILYATTRQQGNDWVPDDSDRILGRIGTLLPARIYGITHEQIRLQFGTALTRLWTRSRSVVSSQSYEVWDQNIPAYYDRDIYQQDPTTGSIVTIDPSTGKATYTILHHKGDPVLNPDGSPVYQFKIGDIKRDPATGQPIVAQTRSLAHQVDFMLVEGVYKFATDPSAVSYRQQMIDTIVTWLSGDLETLGQRLLDRSQLFFYPKKTIGQAQVLYGQGLTAYVDMGQSPTLTLYLGQTAYNNAQLRDQLRKTSIQTVSQQLNTRQVSRSAIVDTLRGQYGTDVIDAELSGLGGAANYDVFTLLDDSIRPSLRKRLTAQSDGSLIVAEDLSVVFVLHDPVTLQ